MISTKIAYRWIQKEGGIFQPPPRVVEEVQSHVSRVIYAHAWGSCDRYMNDLQRMVRLCQDQVEKGETLESTKVYRRADDDMKRRLRVAFEKGFDRAVDDIRESVQYYQSRVDQPNYLQEGESISFEIDADMSGWKYLKGRGDDVVEHKIDRIVDRIPTLDEIKQRVMSDDDDMLTHIHVPRFDPSEGMIVEHIKVVSSDIDDLDYTYTVSSSYFQSFDLDTFVDPSMGLDTHQFRESERQDMFDLIENRIEDAHQSWADIDPDPSAFVQTQYELEVTRSEQSRFGGSTQGGFSEENKHIVILFEVNDDPLLREEVSKEVRERKRVARHEVQHLGQMMLQKMLGLDERAGLPSKMVRQEQDDSDEDDFMSSPEHAELDHEFYTDLQDQADIFVQMAQRYDDDIHDDLLKVWTHAVSPDQVDVPEEAAQQAHDYGKPVFGVWSEKNREKYQKGIKEFVKEVRRHLGTI